MEQEVILYTHSFVPHIYTEYHILSSNFYFGYGCAVSKNANPGAALERLLFITGSLLKWPKEYYQIIVGKA